MDFVIVHLNKEKPKDKSSINPKDVSVTFFKIKFLTSVLELDFSWSKISEKYDLNPFETREFFYQILKSNQNNVDIKNINVVPSKNLEGSFSDDEELLKSTMLSQSALIEAFQNFNKSGSGSFDSEKDE